MEYESPIEVVMGQVYDKVNQKCDEMIFEAVRNVGINVNREELIRALKFDREQFQRGFEAGYREGKRDARDYQNGRFDCLDYLSGMDYGKKVYFMQNDGTVYSWKSCQYMSLDGAISEYGSELE